MIISNTANYKYFKELVDRYNLIIVEMQNYIFAKPKDVLVSSTGYLIKYNKYDEIYVANFLHISDINTKPEVLFCHSHSMTSDKNQFEKDIEKVLLEYHNAERLVKEIKNEQRLANIQADF